MSARTNRWAIAAATVALILGAMLSRVVEPGIRVEQIMLTTNTPALRFSPATPGPHPIALLAHGNLLSKEWMFRFGEALAAAGFDCYSVDQAGFGESPQPCSLSDLRRKPQELEQVLGRVHVFIGHSMGGELGAWGVREGKFRPKFFIGVGCKGNVGEHGPPVLLLLGRFDELAIPALTKAHVIISPWSVHALEASDPVLVNAAVRAACGAVGKIAPNAPTAWRWRFAGLVLGIGGALVLTFCLPDLHPHLARNRGWIVPAVLLGAIILTLRTWLGMTPQLRRIPQQMVFVVVIWLALTALHRLRMPRWSLPVVTGILTLGCLPLWNAYPKNFFPFLMLTMILASSTLSLLAGVAVGRIATRGGSRRDGDAAMAFFAGYGIGQIMPMFY